MPGDYPRFQPSYTHDELVEHFLLLPVLPEYSYHMERISVRVSREPTSGINRQAVCYA